MILLNEVDLHSVSGAGFWYNVGYAAGVYAREQMEILEKYMP